MNLQYNQLDVLEKELVHLPPLHRVAFAAACCERLFPNYVIFERKIRELGWNEPDPMRVALDEIWQYLGGKEISETRFRHLLSNCEEYPYEYENKELPESQRAAWAILYALDLCLEPTAPNAILVAIQIEETLFEYLDYLMEESEGTSRNKRSHKEMLEVIVNHPFTLREMAKQSEDLQQLQATQTLTSEFLNWLRTSSQNGGKSLIDLG